MLKYDLRDLKWRLNSLYWYEQSSFIVKAINKRFTIHIDDYVKLKFDRYAQVRQLFTHCFQFENIRRIFVWIKLLQSTFYIDEILNLNILRTTNNEKIVSVLTIKLEKTYIISIDRVRNELICTNTIEKTVANYNNDDNDNMNLLYCTWTINFL